MANLSAVGTQANGSYLGAAIGLSDPADPYESNLTQLLNLVSDPSMRSDALVGETGRTVAECLAALVDSGTPENCEFVMNCALGTGEIATCAKSLLAKPFLHPASPTDTDTPQLTTMIRTMAQSVVEMGARGIGSIGSDEPEILLMAGTVLADGSGDDAIPSDVKDAIKAFSQGEWRPVWWIMQPPSSEGTFSLGTVKSLEQGFEGIPTRAKTVNVQADGSCMFRSCLALHLGEQRWVDREVSKDELYQKLQELGWDQTIKTAIQTAYDDLCVFMQPTEEVQAAFDVDDLFNRTVASRDFNLYSPMGIGTLMEGKTRSDEAADEFFFETLADSIAQKFIELAGVKMAPTHCGDPGKFGDGGAWLVLKSVHYDLLVTDGFFRELHAEPYNKA